MFIIKVLVILFKLAAQRKTDNSHHLAADVFIFPAEMKVEYESSIHGNFIF
jgi:hypothetical protein